MVAAPCRGFVAASAWTALAMVFIFSSMAWMRCISALTTGGGGGFGPFLRSSSAEESAERYWTWTGATTSSFT